MSWLRVLGVTGLSRVAIEPIHVAAYIESDERSPATIK
jgi:hypothetical protein